MSSHLPRVLVVLSLLGSLHATFGAEESVESRAAEKRQYTLWNPTPDNSMREFNTDRPDKTESAYTVDAGHFQMEADLLSYVYDVHNSLRDDVRVDGFSFASVNLKVGVLNDLDVQLIISTYNYVRVEDRVAKDGPKNFRPRRLTLRSKYNFWGNDRGHNGFSGDALLRFLPRSAIWATSG